MLLVFHISHRCDKHPELFQPTGSAVLKRAASPICMPNGSKSSSVLLASYGMGYTVQLMTFVLAAPTFQSSPGLIIAERAVNSWAISSCHLVGESQARGRRSPAHSVGCQSLKWISVLRTERKTSVTYKPGIRSTVSYFTLYE